MSSMSLRHYVTSIHIKKESHIVGYECVRMLEVEIYSLFSQHLI